jgi:glycosyltransferase involved in cell wall biosynthesis
MITIGYSTKKSKPEFTKYLEETSGIKDCQVIEKENPGKYSLTEIYNQILSESKFDIVVFCHDDIYFEKNYWGKRILEHFEKNSEYGILGVAGTMYYPSSGMWWEIQGEMIGQVWHQHEGKKWLSEYNKPFGSKIIESVVVDGVFFAVNKKNINHNFDETVKGFHFYDTTFCIKNFLSGVKVGTISNVPLTHLSVGMVNQQWDENRKVFAEKFKDSLPIKLESSYPKNVIDEKKPLVSVIIPVYNYGNQFEKTLSSVFDSTYKNFEIIIVNDGSTDNYVKMKLDSLYNHPNIKVIHQENNGPSSARNNGVKNSKGQYILPLDADDTIHPEYIQTCVSILKNNKNVSPVYCDTLHVGQMQGVEKRPEWSLERLIQGPFIVNCSMFTRESFDKCEGYDETMKGWEDYDLWIRMAKNGYVGKRIPKALFMYFHHEKDGTVSTQANQNQQELYNKIMSKNFNNETV